MVKFKQYGAGVTALFVPVLIVLVLIGVMFSLFGQVVPPGNMGVTQVLVGPGQGYGEEGHGPGLYLSIPFYRKVHSVPQDLRILDFNRHSEIANSLEIKATDGAVVDVDISVLTRFFTKKGNDLGVDHGGPRELFTNVGSTEKSWNQAIALVASNELRRALGTLQSNAFYDVTKREPVLVEAESNARKNLAAFGIYVEAILLRRYTYRDDRIDEAIFNKNLQDQEQRLKEGASNLAQVKAELEQVAAEWDAKIITLKVKGDNQASVLKAEAQRYETEKVADGDLLVANAQSAIDKKKANVLQSQASQVLIAQELSPLINTLKGGVVKDIDPYSLSSWISKFGVTQGGAQ